MLRFGSLARLAVMAAYFVILPVSAASDGDEQMDEAFIDPDNIPSLQRGAKNFINYCSGCHSAQYVRYNTIGKHLQLSEEQLVNNLMFNAVKTFETMRAAMPAQDAERWFGTAPPDMSLIARAKGADHIYNFLKDFYIDPDSPTGVDNRVLAGTSMPHVLWELQGYQKTVFSEIADENGTTYHFDGFEQVTTGLMNAEEYDDFVRDTVNFLAYIAEPIRSDRRRLGKWVLIYLFIFLIIAWMLKNEVWKDVN
ncbi:MAG: cytochrome c1 [Proteobacteria bacterium]|nr:cytochrome c1 [Pseudomonadota bacterium]